MVFVMMVTDVMLSLQADNTGEQKAVPTDDTEYVECGLVSSDLSQTLKHP